MEAFIPLLNIVSWLFLVVLIVVGIIAFQAIIALFITRVPYAGTPMPVIRAIVDVLDVDENDVVYDLGCGDGRFLAEAGKRNVRGIGYELRLWQWLKAKIRTRKAKKAEIRLRNFYKDDLSDARVVFCFLLPKLLLPMWDKLKKETKSGTLVYSYVFKIEGVESLDTMVVSVNGREKKVYVYKI